MAKTMHQLDFEARPSIAHHLVIESPAEDLADEGRAGRLVARWRRAPGGGLIRGWEREETDWISSTRH